MSFIFCQRACAKESVPLRTQTAQLWRSMFTLMGRLTVMEQDGAQFFARNIKGIPRMICVLLVWRRALLARKHILSGLHPTMLLKHTRLPLQRPSLRRFIAFLVGFTATRSLRSGRLLVGTLPSSYNMMIPKPKASMTP